jgi:hypothetical protein
MKKMIFAILSLTVLGMLPACCGCNWGCKGKRERTETTKKRSGGRYTNGNVNNNY